MADIGTLVVKMAADSAQMRSELDRVKSQLKKTDDGVKEMSASMKKAGKFIAGAFSVAVIAGFAARVNDAADSLNDLAGKLNVSASSLNMIQLAAQQSGGTVEGVTTAFQAMSNKIGEAVGGSKQASEAFARLGLNAQQLASMKPDEAFRAIAAATAGIDNQFQRAAASQDIFGKGARDIQGLLNEGTGAIDEARAALERHGAAISDLDIARIGVMNDELGAQSTIIQNLATKTLAGFAPAISVATGAFSDLLQSVTGSTSAGRTMGIVFTGAIKTIQFVGANVFSTFETLRFVVLRVLGSIVRGLEDMVGMFAWVADKLGLDVAQRLYAARDGIAGIANSMHRMGTAASESAVSSAAAAGRYASELFNAAGVYDAAAARMEASAAARMGGGMGAVSGGGGGKPGERALTPAEIRERDAVKRDADFKREYDLTALHFSNLQMLSFDHASALASIDSTSAAQRIQVASDFEYFRADVARAFGLQQLDFEAIKNASIIDLAGGLFTALAGQNTKLFKVQQAFAIANAVINTAEGITKALRSLPFPANLGAAAKVALAGAIQVAKIRSTVPGGSASVTSTGLSGGSSGASPALPQSAGNASQAEQSPRIAQVVIQGSVFSSRETADWLVEQLSEAINNRDVVFINGNSRQAGLIAGA
jgi:hypothetical protein